MNIFNSLGSNYDRSVVAAALQGDHSPRSIGDLSSYLEGRYQGTVHFTYKGREALRFALEAAGLGRGSTVAITGFTCYAVYKAAMTAGCKVHYLDLDEGSLNFSADELRKAAQANPELRAVIVQNTLGFPCDIAGIEAACKKHGLVIIEDLAHSVGARYADGREAGTVGHLVMLSFGRDKVIDAVSGGALVIRNPKFRDFKPPGAPPAPMSARLRDRLYPGLSRVIRSTYPAGLGAPLHSLFKGLGLLSKATDGEFYTGYALPEWQAQLALARFESLAPLLEHRRRIAGIYREQLPASVQIPGLGALKNSAALRYPILVPDRQGLFGHLAARGVHITDTWYDTPVAPSRFLSQTTYRHQCPRSEAICAQVANLPTHQGVTQQTAAKIGKEISQWLKSA